MTVSLQELRRTIAGLERRTGRGGKGLREKEEKEPWRLGLAELEAHLPGGALPRDGLVELAATGARDAGAAVGFSLALLARLPAGSARRDILWCQTAAAAQEYGALYLPGFAPFALAPGRLVKLCARRRTDILWAAEEGLRSGALAAVVAEGAPADLTASRRLALAAGETRTPCLLLDPQGGGLARAASQRWRIAAAPSGPNALDPRASGERRWEVELLHARGGRPGTWKLAWDDEAHSFRLAAGARDREMEARPRLDREGAEPSVLVAFRG